MEAVVHVREDHWKLDWMCSALLVVAPEVVLEEGCGQELGRLLLAVLARAAVTVVRLLLRRGATEWDRNVEPMELIYSLRLAER